MKKVLSILALFAVAITAFVTSDASILPMAFSDNNFLPTLAALPMFLADSSQARIAYQRVLELATTRKFIVAPGDIRSEILVSNSTTNYQFEVRDVILQGQIATRPLVKGVLDNDLFIAFTQGLFIDHRTALATNVILQTYPNAAHFSASTAAYTDLWALYNGQLSVQVGSTQFINQFNTQNFATVPQTQKSLTTNESEFDMKTACKDLGSYSIFSGKADNQVNVNIKTYSGYAAAPASGENVFTYWAHGFIVRNGANAFEDFRNVLAPNSNG